MKGDPTPSLRASAGELIGIALGMKGAGQSVTEFISDSNTPRPESEFDMIDRVLTRAAGPLGARDRFPGGGVISRP